MNKTILPIVIMLFLIHSAQAETQNPYRSKYAGEHNQEIKGLSSDDISELQRGGGWGLAKAAELNGIPGPAHLLELRSEINLSPAQFRSISVLYQSMKMRAINKGAQLVALERKLEDQFVNGSITDSNLKSLLKQIAKVRSELRYIHLSTHLETPNILTKSQIAKYVALRGYNNDPCKNIPPGHDQKMWKKHNNCK